MVLELSGWQESPGMLDTHADSWAAPPEILIQSAAISQVTQDLYFVKHCYSEFQTE